MTPFERICLAALIVAVAMLWVYGQTLRAKLRDKEAECLRLRDSLARAHQGWARDNDYNNQRLATARNRFIAIGDIVSRRPPRRRWLAMARKIAQIVELGV